MKDDTKDDPEEPTDDTTKVQLPACLLKRPREEKTDGKDDSDDNDDDNGPDDKLTMAVARLINTHIVLMPDTGGTDKALGECIAATKAGSWLAAENGCSNGKGNVLIIMDPANMTESSSHPHLRRAQIKPEYVDRAVNAGLAARWKARFGDAEVNDGETLGNDEVWLLFDGGRQAANILHKPFRKNSKKVNVPITITYDEDTLLQNVGRVMSMGSLRCTETMHIVSSNTWSCPRRPHINYSGSNYSDQIGPVKVKGQKHTLGFVGAGVEFRFWWGFVGFC